MSKVVAAAALAILSLVALSRGAAGADGTLDEGSNVSSSKSSKYWPNSP